MEHEGSLPYLQACEPLKATAALIIFKNPVRTSKRTPQFAITEINCLVLFKDIITVYRDKHTKHSFADVKTAAKYNYR
jgi:hypothetical protein